MSVNSLDRPAGQIQGSPEGGRGKRLWQAGTLTYTTAGLAALFFWLLWGDFAWSMRDRSVPSVMQTLFRLYGASDLLVGLILTSLPALLGMVIQPVIGYQSDRLRSRWGRRIPFLVAPIPFVVAAIIGLAFCPRLGAELHRLLGPRSPGVPGSILLVITLCWTVFEIGAVTANGVFNGLINDVVPQPVIGRFFGLFRALSLISGILFNYVLFGKAETNFAWIFLGIAVLYGFGFALMCLKVREGSYPPPAAPESRGAGGFLAAARAYFRDAFGSPYYRWFFAAIVFGALANAPINIYSLFYARSLDLSQDAYGKCIALTYAISLVLAYPLGVLADRFHPLRVSIAALALYAVMMLWGSLAVKGAVSYGVALVAHGVLTGTFFTASASLNQRLLPAGRFTELASAGSVLTSLGMIGLSVALGSFLDWSGHCYRYVFPIGFVLTLAALGFFLVLHHKFMALGGPLGYTAPESQTQETKII